MRDWLYSVLENFSGLKKDTLLSGVCTTAIFSLIPVAQFILKKISNKDSPNLEPAFLYVGKDIIDSEIEDLDIQNLSTTIINVNGSIKKSTIKRVKVFGSE